MKLIAGQAGNTWATGRFHINLALRAAWTLAAAIAPAWAATAAPAASADSPVLQAFSSAPEGAAPAPWRVVGLPGNPVPLTQFRIHLLDGARVLQVRADKSYGTLSHVLASRVPGSRTTLQWRWRLDQPLASPNLRRKDGDDAALKVCAMFDMPLERLGFVERNVLRLARARSGEPLPAATLCYVWDPTLQPGTLLPNVYSARVRYLVLNGPEAPLRQWASHSRNLQQDFVKAFGDESPSVPPLIAVVVGADADNTAGSSLAYVGDVVLVEQSGP